MSDKTLYEHWRGAVRDEPPAELDARIVAAAHAATVDRPPPRRPSWIARFAPLSLAAVAVLGVALSMRVAEEEPGLRQALPPPGESVAAPPASAELPAAGAPAAAAVEQAAREVAAEAERRGDRLMRDSAVGSAKRLQESAGVSGERAPATERPAPRRKAATEADSALRAPAAAALRAEEVRGAIAEPADAARWLADIERLLAAGETEQARQELRRFQLAYPGHPLSEALRPLAAE